MWFALANTWKDASDEEWGQGIYKYVESSDYAKIYGLSGSIDYYLDEVVRIVKKSKKW